MPKEKANEEESDDDDNAKFGRTSVVAFLGPELKSDLKALANGTKMTIKEIVSRALQEFLASKDIKTLRREYIMEQIRNSGMSLEEIQSEFEASGEE